MKRMITPILTLCCVITFFHSTLYAQTPAQAWGKFDPEAKASFVSGFKMGIRMSIQTFAKYYTVQGENTHPLQLLNAIMKADKNVMVSGIDRFYSEPFNSKISLYGAIIIVVRRITGDPEKEIQSDLKKMRKEYDKEKE